MAVDALMAGPMREKPQRALRGAELTALLGGRGP